MLGVSQMMMGIRAVSAAAYTYILNWVGSGASDASFNNNDVLDTAAEGIVGGAGTATVKIPVAGTVAISSGALAITHDASDNIAECGISFDLGSTKTAGTGFFIGYKHNDTSVFSAFVLHNSATLSAYSSYFLYKLYIVSTLKVIYNEDCRLTAHDVVTSTDYNDFCFVMGQHDVNGKYSAAGLYGHLLFYKKRSDTTWRLAAAMPQTNTAQLYAHAHGYTASKVINIDYAKLTTTDISASVAPVHTTDPSTSLVDVGYADIKIGFKITTGGSLPATNPTYLDFNMSDADNGWRIKILPKTSGTTITLHKIAAGVEGAALASGSMTFAASTSYQFHLTKDGSSFRGLGSFINTSAPYKLTPWISYTTSDTHTQTATNIRWTAGDQTLVHQQVFKVTGYTLTIPS